MNLSRSLLLVSVLILVSAVGGALAGNGFLVDRGAGQSTGFVEAKALVPTKRNMTEFQEISLPGSWGNLVTVSMKWGSPDIHFLWFQAADGTVRMVSVVDPGYYNSGPVFEDNVVAMFPRE